MVLLPASHDEHAVFFVRSRSPRRIGEHDDLSIFLVIAFRKGHERVFGKSRHPADFGSMNPASFRRVIGDDQEVSWLIIGIDERLLHSFFFSQ